MFAVRGTTRVGRRGRRPAARVALGVLVLVGGVWWRAAAAKSQQEPPAISGPRDLFDLQGIDRSHFDLLTDGKPWQASENETLLKIVYRLHRSFRPMDVESWCLGDARPAELAREPDAYRGQIFRLAGRVVSLEVRRPVPEVARRFELDAYYRCGFLLGENEAPAVLFAHTVPEAWKAEPPTGARSGAFGVFLKLAGDAPQQPVPVFVASRVAWYPPNRLGNLGFDWGLFDDLRPRAAADDEGTTDGRAGAERPRAGDPEDYRLTGRNRECFYQMLAAVGRTRPGELRAEAAGRLERAGKERFSVAPLFNRPSEQHGRLVVLSGTAREVAAVRVGDADVIARFGIDHYYQVVLFTEDSRSASGLPGRNPVVFCVRELPENMPRGEGPGFAEHVTAAGFFFNRWAYRNRRSGDAAARAEWQLAPLLIGRDLVWHAPTRAASNPYFGAVAGGVFVLVLVGLWLALWRYGRGDRRFHQRTIARKYAPAPGAPLDALGLDADASPDFSGWEQAADPGPSPSDEPARPDDEESPRRDSEG